MQTVRDRHAIVFGASGLAGWAIVDQLLRSYPSAGTFAKVTALVNRPLALSSSFWPQLSHPAFQLVSGVDLTQGTVEAFAEGLKGKVGGLEDVTEVFYFAYRQDDDQATEVESNISMLERAIGALNLLCPKLSFVVWPSGAKAYGIHLAQKPLKAPFIESLTPTAEVYATTWYPQFGKLLDRARQGLSWQWTDVRPDAIIGFAPSGSTFNLTAHWALYLSLYAKVEGQGAEVSFPGSMKAYKSSFNEASSKMIARLAIWASLNPDKAAGEAFNIADQAKAQTMEDRWPRLAAYFGLKGVGPSEDEDVLLPGQYVKQHINVLDRLGIQGSQVWKGEFLDTYGFYLDFDRQLSLEKARGKGFMEETDPNQSWFDAFDRFKDAGMIV